MILLISGDGVGAGKTTAARRLGTRRSLAYSMRQELAAIYPAYDWHNSSQDYKANTAVVEAGGRSVREVLLEYGQSKCVTEPAYWARLLADQIESEPESESVCVDDLRKVVELEYFRGRFPGLVTHLHILTEHAVAEPQFENEELRERADYILIRGDEAREVQARIDLDAALGLLGGAPAAPSVFDRGVAGPAVKSQQGDPA